MTLHLKRINGFGNGNGGGGGGSVEVLEEGYIGIKTDEGSSGYSGLVSVGERMPIDDTNILSYSYVPYSGYGTKTIYIYSSFINGSVKDSKNLDFGQTYAMGHELGINFAISPNKDSVAISGVSGNYNIYVVPLIKSGDNYSFGEIVTYTGSVSNSRCSWIDNTTFVSVSSSNLNVYKYENDTITLLKTISLSGNPYKAKAYGNKIVLVYNQKVEIIDYTTETVLYTYTPSFILASYILIYKNFAVFFPTSGSHYLVLDLEQNTTISMTSTLKPDCQGDTFTFYDDDYIEFEDNKIGIAKKITGYTTYSIWYFDFTNKNISTIDIVNPILRVNSSDISYSTFHYKEGKMFLGRGYQGSGTTGVWELYACPSKISYDGFDYSVADKSASE